MEYSDEESNADEIEEEENIPLAITESLEAAPEEIAEEVDEENYDENAPGGDLLEGSSVESGYFSFANTNDEATKASVFTSDVAETMNALRAACQDLPNEKTARISLEAIKIMCRERFRAKVRLGASGASEHLIHIFRKYRNDSELLALACESISEYMINETENKIMMGSVGLPEEILPAMKLHPKDLHIQSLCLLLAINCCHSKVTGLLQKYTKNKPGGKSSKPPTPRSSYPDYYDIDNRSKLGELGMCKRIVKILKPFTKQHQHPGTDISDPEKLVDTCCRAIAALAENDRNSSLFGKYGVCELLTVLLNHKKLPIDRYIHPLWALITLCADPSNSNQIKFGKAGICKCLVEQIHEIQRTPTYFSRNPHFNKYMEYLAWSFLNLIRHCPENMKHIKHITYAQVVLDNVSSIDVVPRSAKVKLTQVYIEVFEKFYLEEGTRPATADDNKNDDEDDSVNSAEEKDNVEK
jgi:hypothetical protein